MPDSELQRVASVVIWWPQITSPSDVLHCSCLNLCNYHQWYHLVVYFSEHVHVHKQYMSSWFCYFDFLRQLTLPMLTLNNPSLKLCTSSSSCFHFLLGLQAFTTTAGLMHDILTSSFAFTNKFQALACSVVAHAHSVLLLLFLICCDTKQPRLQTLRQL